MLLQWGQGGGRNALSAVLRDGSTVANYRADLGVTGTLIATSVANQIGAAGALAEVAGSGPIYLPFAGQKYGYLPGVAGNYFSTPDSAAASITGDIDIRVQAAATDWTPAAIKQIVSKYVSVGDQRSYTLDLRTDGTLGFTFSVDGIATKFANSTSAVSFADTTIGFVRVTVDVDNGASGYDVKFYTSQDGSIWVQLGTTVTGAGVTSFFDSTAIVEVGSVFTGTVQLWAGNIYRAQIYNGINGTLAVDFNAADWPETTTNGATQASGTTGETWTLNNTGALFAQIVASSQFLFNGTSQYLKAAFTLIQPITYYLVVKQPTWTNNTYIFDGNTAATAILFKTTDGGGASPRIGMYAGTSAPQNDSLILNTFGVVKSLFNGASSALSVNAGADSTGNSGAGNPSGFTLGASGSGIANFSNIQVKEVIIRNVADSAAKQAQIIALLRSIYGF